MSSVYSQAVDMRSIDSLEEALSKNHEPEVDLLLALADAYEPVDWQKSLQFAQHAFEKAKNAGERKAKFLTTYKLAFALERNGDSEKAEELALEAVEYVNDSLELSDTYNLLGMIYESKSSLNLSLEYHIKSLEISLKAGDNQRIISSRNSLAFVYRAMHQQEDAIELLKENLALAEKLNDRDARSRSTFNIGLMILELNKHGEAIPWFQKATIGWTEQENPIMFSYYYNNMANCYERLLHIDPTYYDSALYYGHKSLELKKQLKNIRGIANTHNLLADTYEKRSEWANSYFHSTEALRISDSLSIKPMKVNALSYLITAELMLGKTENTNDHFEEFKSLRQELFDEAKSEQAAEMATKYELEKQFEEKKMLEEQKVEQQRINTLLVALVVILIISLGLLYYLIRTKQKNHAELVKDKEIIERQSKELSEMNVMKSSFFASISHELRTPLTLIQGNADEVLSTKKLPNSALEPLRKIKRNIHQLSVMVEDLLDMSRLELHQRQANLKPLDVNAILRRLCAAFTSMAESKHISFKYEFAKKEPVAVMLDEALFEKIINNLIYNAFKLSRTNGKIGVILQQVHDGVEIKITDNGLGIAEEELPYIFDRFFQSKSNNPQSFGSGMGLAIAKELTHLMSGDIEVISEFGKGTTFTLKFRSTDLLPEPSRYEDLVIGHEQTEEDQDKLEIPSNTTILVVEDNNDVSEYLTKILKDHFSVMVAANGQEALNQLEKQKPDLVLTDVMMPIMDGWELIENIKNTPRFSQIPVIVLTAVADSDEKVKGLRMGVDDYILKPFESEELMIRISNLVNNLRERIKWAKEYEEETEAAPDQTESHQLIVELKSYVQDNIDNKQLNIAQLAMHLGLSERQLYRKTSELVGLSPSKLILEIKLQHARELLLSQKFSKLSQIASEIGFDSSQYFSKLYTERFGKKPSDYFS
jgi:signal transduction histidine kinase/DNA-binding response OmpR family regulator